MQWHTPGKLVSIPSHPGQGQVLHVDSAADVCGLLPLWMYLCMSFACTVHVLISCVLRVAGIHAQGYSFLQVLHEELQDIKDGLEKYHQSCAMDMDSVADK